MNMAKSLERTQLALRTVRQFFRGCGTIPVLCLAVFLAAPGWALAQSKSLSLAAVTSDLVYTNYRVADVPWSIHVVRLARTNSQFEIHSLHAEGSAVGLGTVSSQIRLLDPALGTPVAAVNGDFYQRGGAYAGNPRGMQVVDGEVYCAPDGGVVFWIDGAGQPELENVVARFRVTWPNGTATALGLNEPRRPNAAVLYTPAIGPSTLTAGGRELVLEKQGDGPWLPLRMEETYQATVREIRERGNSPVPPDALVLSLGAVLARSFPNLTTGAVLKISTASIPSMAGAITAISGGPVLLQDGKRVRVRTVDSDSYIFNSMSERHPRTAFGWNSKYFFLVEVDGRQWNLSAGMTLDELSNFMGRLGCEDALNLDGGGSATFWYNGRVRNRPCDGHERNVANSLVIVKKKAAAESPPQTAKSSTPSSP
jgi:hypothetical protein